MKLQLPETKTQNRLYRFRHMASTIKIAVHAITYVRRPEVCVDDGETYDSDHVSNVVGLYREQPGFLLSGRIFCQPRFQECSHAFRCLLRNGQIAVIVRANGIALDVLQIIAAQGPQQKPFCTDHGASSLSISASARNTTPTEPS